MAEQESPRSTPGRIAFNALTVIVLMGIGAYMIYYLYQS